MFRSNCVLVIIRFPNHLSFRTIYLRASSSEYQKWGLIQLTIFPPCMQPDASVQRPSTDQYPEPLWSNLHRNTLILIIHLILPSTSKPTKWTVHSGFPTKSLNSFLIFTCPAHVATDYVIPSVPPVISLVFIYSRKYSFHCKRTKHCNVT